MLHMPDPNLQSWENTHQKIQQLKENSWNNEGSFAPYTKILSAEKKGIIYTSCKLSSVTFLLEQE